MDSGADRRSGARCASELLYSGPPQRWSAFSGGGCAPAEVQGRPACSSACRLETPEPLGYNSSITARSFDSLTALESFHYARISDRTVATGSAWINRKRNTPDALKAARPARLQALPALLPAHLLASRCKVLGIAVGPSRLLRSGSTRASHPPDAPTSPGGCSLQLAPPPRKAAPTRPSWGNQPCDEFDRYRLTSWCPTVALESIAESVHE